MLLGTQPAAEPGEPVRIEHASGPAYLLSSAFLDPERAFQLMDREEVGRSVNP